MHFVTSVILSLSLVIPTLALAEFQLFPIVYEVVSVPDGDVLNVREEPSASSYDLDDLLPGQQAEVTALDETGTWARILWHGGDAWVSLKFMQPVKQYGDDFSTMPINQQCGGAEPFWSVDITYDSQFGFTEMGGDTEWMPIETSTMSHNMYRSNYAFETPRFTGFIRRAECSNGVSDKTYGWALDLLEKGKGDLWSGCCQTNLPVVDGY
ncbi:MAG: SH3 domain-containing protein [Rhodobacteraceae bacterium]|nr:SH3 domain-containing protein [Paracoccaceae bacterium]